MLSMKIFQRLKNRMCPFLRIERIRLEDYQAYILLALRKNPERNNLEFEKRDNLERKNLECKNPECHKI